MPEDKNNFQTSPMSVIGISSTILKILLWHYLLRLQSLLKSSNG